MFTFYMDAVHVLHNESSLSQEEVSTILAWCENNIASEVYLDVETEYDIPVWMCNKFFFSEGFRIPAEFAVKVWDFIEKNHAHTSILEPLNPHLEWFGRNGWTVCSKCGWGLRVEGALGIYGQRKCLDCSVDVPNWEPEEDPFLDTMEHARPIGTPVTSEENDGTVPDAWKPGTQFMKKTVITNLMGDVVLYGD